MPKTNETKNLFLVTYDLNSPGQRWDTVLAFISQYDHLRLSESTYLVEAESNTMLMFQAIKLLADEADIFFLTQVTQPIVGQGHKATSDWIRSKTNKH